MWLPCATCLPIHTTLTRWHHAWQRTCLLHGAGKSSVGPPARPNMRIDFQFDQAAFTFRKLPFSIPYPLPFR